MEQFMGKRVIIDGCDRWYIASSIDQEGDVLVKHMDSLSQVHRFYNNLVFKGSSAKLLQLEGQISKLTEVSEDLLLGGKHEYLTETGIRLKTRRVLTQVGK